MFGLTSLCSVRDRSALLHSNKFKYRFSGSRLALSNALDGVRETNGPFISLNRVIVQK